MTDITYRLKVTETRYSIYELDAENDKEAERYFYGLLEDHDLGKPDEEIGVYFEVTSVLRKDKND
jgi:hypothetical protein